MKLTLLALALTLTAPLAAQTDAMPPETQAPAPMAMPAKPPVKPSKSLTVTFQGNTVVLSVEDLLNLPQQTITAHDGHTNKDVTFTGPLVADVLAKAGLAPTEKNHALILHSTVVATGTDAYFVLYSCAELEPMFSSGNAIIAVMQTGLPVESGIQLVNPFDAKPARWVHGLSSLSVMSLTPSK